MPATERPRARPILEIAALNVYYGQAHALQNVSLALESGVLAVVGRNGMGKSTLCYAIAGLVPATGSIKLDGQPVLGLAPEKIANLGIALVPQGRRVWPSLSVDEHLRLASKSARTGAWTVQRVYDLFPRLAERRRNGGAQLSGGEQQMLAIARALLLNPRLLVMDEPTEGLAPVIVEQVTGMLAHLAHEGEVSVLLIEQNLGVAVHVADEVAVMVNGRIARRLPAVQLMQDIGLQQRLLGVRANDAADEQASNEPEALAWEEDSVQVLTVRRAHAAGDAPVLAGRAVVGTSEWRPADTAGSGNAAGDVPTVAGHAPVITSQWRPADGSAHDDRDSSSDVSFVARAARTGGPPDSALDRSTHDASAPQRASETSPRSNRVLALPTVSGSRLAAYIAGTFDTKGRELQFVRNCLERAGVRTVTVDLSTSGKLSTANVSPAEVARMHPKGANAVFTGDRGSAVSAMALAFERYIASRRDVGGLISAGGSGGTALATQAMRHLPIGVPKVMVSTVASGDVKAYVGPTDICMMYAVTDVSGINRISEQVLANAAHALAGMMTRPRVRQSGDAVAATKPAIGLTMFGVTTPCVQAVTRQLEERYDCLTFHATGAGGQSMEKLAASGLLAAVLDVTTTEVADELVGGVFSAGPERLDAIIDAKIPYIGSCGALDMVNFHAMETVPAKFRARKLYKHNSNVTLTFPIFERRETRIQLSHRRQG